MKKLIVSNFCNALIDSEEAIPLSTMLEIERIRKAGSIFAVCTNKPYTDVLSYNRDFPFLDYIIALNGAYIYDVKKEKYLQKKKLSQTVIKKVIKSYKDKKIHFFTENKMYYTIPLEDTYKIEIEYSRKIDLSPLEGLDINTSTFTYNKKRYLEITSKAVDNFLAVEKIATNNKITLKEITVIGANEADLPLIKKIKDNYVVRNAPTILKKMASKKTSSNDSKGVEKVLKKI